MKEEQATVPHSVRSLFWEIDKDGLDLKKDKRFIIYKVLNYGTLSDWRWLIKKYGSGAIKDAVAKQSHLRESGIREQSRRFASLLIK